MGLKKNIANYVNRVIDYGFNWMFYEKEDIRLDEINETKIYQQLKYLYEKKKKKKGYIKAVYLHHLLDFFKETHIDIHKIDLVFEKFLQDKVVVEITDSEGNIINFQEEINEVFRVIKGNKDELYEDLKGEYLFNLEKSKLETSKKKKKKENIKD